MHIKPQHFALAFALTSPGAFAQTAPSVEPAYAGATMVSGHANPGQAPVIIYDATTSAHTALGSSQSIDRMGNFAVMVTARLIAGHSIVVVDHSGAVSPPMVVVARPGSSSHQ